MRVSCNAIDILGGHEDAIGFNPEQRVLSNADYANSADQIVAVMREQRKGGADFTKIYETGPDHLEGDTFTTPYQYTEAQLAAAVAEAHRTGSRVGVHCTGEPGRLLCSGGRCGQHRPRLQSLARHDEDRCATKQIYAVPTFAIVEYFAPPQHGDGAVYKAASSPTTLRSSSSRWPQACRSPSVSDVGPFPHGTQAREYELMVKYGMSPADTLRAGLINGAKLLDWADAIGQLKPGFYADVIAVPGNPLEDISVLKSPAS
jgi:imidazolonepropionase-like amidohydrolase